MPPGAVAVIHDDLLCDELREPQGEEVGYFQHVRKASQDDVLNKGNTFPGDLIDHQEIEVPLLQSPIKHQISVAAFGARAVKIAKCDQRVIGAEGEIVI